MERGGREERGREKREMGSGVVVEVGGVIYFLEYLCQGRGSGGVRKCKKIVESLLNYPRISMNNEKIIKYCFFLNRSLGVGRYLV